MIESKVYFRRWPSGDWIYQGSTYGTGNLLFSIPLFEDWDEWEVWKGINCLWSGYKFEWRIDTYDTVTELTTTGDVWDFITTIEGSIWWRERYINYDPHYFFQQSANDGDGDWVDAGELNVADMDAGRLKRSLVVVSSKGDIYFGEV